MFCQWILEPLEMIVLPVVVTIRFLDNCRAHSSTVEGTATAMLSTVLLKKSRNFRQIVRVWSTILVTLLFQELYIPGAEHGRKM